MDAPLPGDEILGTWYELYRSNSCFEPPWSGQATATYGRLPGGKISVRNDSPDGGFVEGTLTVLDASNVVKKCRVDFTGGSWYYFIEQVSFFRSLFRDTSANYCYELKDGFLFVTDCKNMGHFWMLGRGKYITTEAKTAMAAYEKDHTIPAHPAVAPQSNAGST